MTKGTENRHRNPLPTVDIIIEIDGGIVLIERANPPYGWAIPGGFVEYGESLETAACREAKEETGLELTALRQFHTYSEPGRDARCHTITTVYIARGKGTLKADTDAKTAKVFSVDDLPEREAFAFDHRMVIEDYLRYRVGKEEEIFNSEK